MKSAKRWVRVRRNDIRHYLVGGVPAGKLLRPGLRECQPNNYATRAAIKSATSGLRVGQSSVRRSEVQTKRTIGFQFYNAIFPRNGETPVLLLLRGLPKEKLE